MPKITQYEIVRNLRLVISFNQQIAPQEGGLPTYQPIRVEARADVDTADGGHKVAIKVLNFGNPVAKVLTLKQIYTNIKAVNATLGDLIKDTILEALDEDVSV